MPNLKVTLVELSAWENVVPLVSGYLQSYAIQTPLIASNCRFNIYTRAIPIDLDEVLRDLVEFESDVYAFSCYMWNMVSVKRVLDQLVLARPNVNCILGGPQVMNFAPKYVPPGSARVVVCNGEGEVTFSEYLKQLIGDNPELQFVPGITFWSDGAFVTTERPSRVVDLDEIPSPFNDSIFPPNRYTSAILETNRGCPFSCGFCYWGAATNSKVHRFSTERVMRDIEWIASRGYLDLFIVDANWGIFARDVDITSYIVSCHNKSGYPIMVYMCAAKNKPDRMSEITQLLVDGGLIAGQPISLQTVNPRALELIDRKNIKQSTYSSLQQDLRQKGIGSYVELIWPLPGESLRDFCQGITRLCRSEADVIVVYPHLLLHNTPIYRQQALHGLGKRALASESGEAEVVISTSWVTEDECLKGYWLYYGVLVLYNLRGLRILAHYLDSSGVLAFADFFFSVAEFIASHPTNRLALFLQRGIDNLSHFDVMFDGQITNNVLHEMRESFDEMLCEYVSRQSWWSDELAKTAFELDLLMRPYAFREPARLPQYDFSKVNIVSKDESAISISSSDRIVSLVRTAENLSGDVHAAATLRIDHGWGHKLPYMDNRGAVQNSYYCHGMMFRVRDILPFLSVVDDRCQEGIRTSVASR